jgi:hypothetical protein
VWIRLSGETRRAVPFHPGDVRLATKDDLQRASA